MAILTVQQARSYASQAGFTGNGLSIIVAIAQAESSLNTRARGTNTDASVDRGILQINNRWHPEVSDACAYDPACSMQAAYRISNRGTNFQPWTTYTSGIYKRFLSGSTGTIPGAGKQWYQYPVTQDYHSGHYALDIGAPRMTPFYFLQSGTVQIADYPVWDGQPGGGEVFIQPDKGGAQEYVYHLDEIAAPIKKKKHVRAGEFIGFSGGQLGGGKHPTGPKWSTGEHIHWGLFTKFLGGRPYGPNPTPLLEQAKNEGVTGRGNGEEDINVPTPPSGTPLSEQVHDVLVKWPGFTGVVLAVDKSMQYQGLKIHSAEGTGIEAIPSSIGAGIWTVLDTVASNALPAMVRFMIWFVGMLLLIGLLWRVVQATGLDDAAITLASRGTITEAPGGPS
jgi:hypothetical protein